MTLRLALLTLASGALWTGASAGPSGQPRAVGAGQAPLAQPKERCDLFGDSLPKDALTRLGTVRFRPGAYVDSLAFTPDGKRVVALAMQRSLTVWDAQSGRELARLKPELDGDILAARPTATGASVVTVEREKQAHFVRVRSGTDLKLTRGYAIERVTMPQFSADGKRLFGVRRLPGENPSAAVWDVETGKMIRSWQPPHEGIGQLELAGDGRTLATSMDKSIRLWDVEDSGRLIVELAGLPKTVNQIALTPDGKLVAAFGAEMVKYGNENILLWENRVHVWEAATGKELYQLSMEAKGTRFGEPLGFVALAFTPDGKELATVGQDGMLRAWSARTGQPLRQFAGDAIPWQKLAFSPDGQSLAIGTGAIRLLDWATGQDRLPQFGHRFSIFVNALTPDGRTVATGSPGMLQLWDAATGQPRRQLVGHDPRVTFQYLRVLPDGQTLVSIDSDRELGWWDFERGARRRTLDTSKLGRWPLDLTSDGATVALSALAEPDDGSIHLVDTTTGKERRRIATRTERVNGAAFAPDGRTLIGWHADRSVTAWDWTTGQELRHFRFAERPAATIRPPSTLQIYSVALAPDGRRLALGNRYDYLAVHDVATGQLVRLVDGLGPHGVRTLAFSPDGRSLAWSAWRQGPFTIHVVEIASGKERVHYDGHLGPVLSLTYAVDGRTLLSSSEDTTALLWGVWGSDAAPTGPLDRAAAWQALAGDDAAAAFAVMRRLAAAPAEAVALLRPQLRPVAAPDAARIAKLIADLDSVQFEERATAQAELTTLAALAMPACRAALQSASSLELRRRLETLLEKQAERTFNPTGHELRLLRAVEVLEMAGSVECRTELQRLAAGAPGAPLTEEANASLRRLTQRRR